MLGAVDRADVVDILPMSFPNFFFAEGGFSTIVGEGLASGGAPLVMEGNLVDAPELFCL